MAVEFEIIRSPEADVHWPEAVELMHKDQQWACTLYDLQTFHRCFPDGRFVFFAAVQKGCGTFLGCIFVSTYPDPNPISMIGDYLVRPDMRGKGVGTALFEAALAVCQPHKYLYSVPALREKYAEKYGFNKIANWRVNTSVVKSPNLRPLKLQHDLTLRIEQPAALGWPAIQAYYKKFLRKANGDQLIKGLCQAQGSYSRVVLTQEDHIVGLARVRECPNKVLSIGPVLGNDFLGASSALRAALCVVPEIGTYKKVVLFWPTNNEDSPKMLSDMSEGKFETLEGQMSAHWTEKVFEDLPMNHVYAISEVDCCIV